MRYLNILIVILLLGCQDVKRPELPDDLIPKDKIVDIYADSYLMNSARSINLKVITDNGVYLDSTIYKKYNIDSLQFAKSNAYYTANLNEYIALFEEVQNRLLQLENKKDSTDLSEIIKAEAEIMKDSVRINSGLIDPVKTDSL
jgi:hypothetical protein